MVIEEKTYNRIRLADFVKLFFPPTLPTLPTDNAFHNKRLYYWARGGRGAREPKYLSWHITGLIALAGCGGGGGGSGGGSGFITIPASGFPSAISATVRTAPPASGFLFNFDDASMTLNGFSLEAMEAYAYSGNSNYLDSQGVSVDNKDEALVLMLSGNDRSGGGGQDFFYGNDNVNRFDGLGGADNLRGNGGNDILIGGGGSDNIDGGPGDDIIWGGGGADTITGGGGNDVIIVIGSPGVRNYSPSDLIIPATALLSRAQSLNLNAVLGLTAPYINNIATGEFTIGETINGDSGINDLIIFGNVDATVSNVMLANFGSGSIILNSRLTISANALASFGDVKFVGRDDSSTLMITGTGTAVFSMMSDLSGQLSISIASGVTLEVPISRLSMLQEAGDNISFSGEGILDFTGGAGGAIAAGGLVGIDIAENLTVTEAGVALDGDESEIMALLSLDVSEGKSPPLLDIGDELRANFTAPANFTDISYTWFRDGNVIVSGSGRDSYHLTGADIGASIAVRVSYRDEDGQTVSIADTSIADTIDISPPELRIDATQGMQVGNIVRIDLDDMNKLIPMLGAEESPDDYIYDVRYFFWRRNGDIIINSGRYIELQGSEDTDFTDFNFDYELRAEDVGAEITAIAFYESTRNNNRVRFYSDAVQAVAANTIGDLDILQERHNAGDVLLAHFVDPDFDKDSHTLSYQWLRGDQAIAGETSDRYTLQETDSNMQINVRVSYTDAFNTDMGNPTLLTAMTMREIFSTEQVAVGADDDLRAFAGLGNFSGVDPKRDAQPIQIENDDITDMHGRQVEAVYLAESLLDTALQRVRINVINNQEEDRAISNRIFANHDELGTVKEVISDLQSFYLPNTEDIIFIHAHDRNLDLDLLFGTYENAILLEAAGNRNEESVYSDGFKNEALYRKWAAEGRVYFVGGHDDGNMLYDVNANDGSTHAGSAAKGYYFLAPHVYEHGNVPNLSSDAVGTSFAVQNFAAKVEAVYNALNYFYRDIDLVETMRILRGAAEHFNSPDDNRGLGRVDLRQLLVDDMTQLKPLADLRQQAGLPATGDTIDYADYVASYDDLF